MVLTPDEPVEVICEMMAFTNPSVLQAAYYTHFCRHKIDRGSTDAPADDSSTDSDDIDNSADAIMERLTHASMRMRAHFDAA